ncbi:hypothetical protein LLG46_08290 [bacterium]|nr:hypothetical protein [bacterium]
MFRDLKNDDAVVLIVQVLAIILVFAVPTTVLALALPDHSSKIVLCGIYLLFATVALFAGAGWREPNYSVRAKIYTLLVLAATIFYVPTSRLITDFDWDFIDFINSVGIRSAYLLSPFLVGLILSYVMRKYTSGK